MIFEVEGDEVGRKNRSWRPLGAVLEPLGSILGFLEALWTILGPSGAVLKTFWEVCRSAEVEWSPPRDPPRTPPRTSPLGRLWGDNRGASPPTTTRREIEAKARSESEPMRRREAKAKVEAGKAKAKLKAKIKAPLTRRQVGGFRSFFDT